MTARRQARARRSRRPATINDGNGGANYSVTFVANTAGAITQTVNHFAVTASPTSVTAGANFILVVTAQDSFNNTVLGYGGTVQFTSSDPLEPHPAGNFTFTPGSGVAYVLGTLDDVGTWTITATDTSVTTASGTTATPVTVTAASASKIVFTQQPTTTQAVEQLRPRWRPRWKTLLTTPSPLMHTR